MTSESKKILSIVVPVYNEEDNVEPLYNAVMAELERLSEDFDYEFVFTDNHSTDRTVELLEGIAARDKKVRVIRFSRNFGFQRSISTGYRHARGHAAIQMDCDLQDPPELIHEFIRWWRRGHQVVYGIRRSRKEMWLINFARKIFYWLIDFLSEDRLPRQAGDFRLVDRVVLDELKKIDDHQPYLRGAIATMGFNQKGIPYDRAGRARGHTKFSLAELVHLAVDGILNHSIIPLRIASYVGISASLVTFLMSVWYIAGKYLFGQDWPRGFATITVLILASASLNAMFLGIIGEYLGRIYQQVKKRPLTIIEKTINI